MPFTHYPKLVANVIFAWVQPPPPDKKNFLNQPRFKKLNRFREPLPPKKSVVAYHEAQNFTRFYGSIYADQPLEVTFSFSNDEVDDDGNWVTDNNLPSLHYDAEALKKAFDPKKSGQGGFLVTIYGRWLKVEVTNVGDKPTEKMRVIVRGSVF